jgi:hypothetical protein
MSMSDSEKVRKAEYLLKQAEEILLARARLNKNCYYEVADVAYAYENLLQAMREVGGTG